MTACLFFLTASPAPAGRVHADLPARPHPVVVGPFVPGPVVYPPAPYYRVSQYEHWQAYGVTRQGRFRPRVVLVPDGAVYYYNGMPYPWLTVRPSSLGIGPLPD
jgi:hypothetical protein